jgi:hypothetical protein
MYSFLNKNAMEENMPQRCEDAFGSIESAQEFLALLAEAVSETKHDVDADIQEHGTNGSRRIDALKIAAYDLEVLEHHIYRSKRLLNDLRMVRRLLMEERGVPQKDLPSAFAPIPLVRMELPVPRPQIARRVRSRKDVAQEQLAQVAVAS